MAEFFVGGKRFVVSKELYEATLPKLGLFELQDSINSLAELERCRSLGVLTCTQQAWDELVELANKIVFEVKWRLFSNEIGITMEVR